MNKLAFTLQEAAEMAATSVPVLRRKIDKNEISVRYINSKPVILATELESWLASLPSEKRTK